MAHAYLHYTRSKTYKRAQLEAVFVTAINLKIEMAYWQEIVYGDYP